MHTNNLEQKSNYTMKNFEFYSLNHNIFSIFYGFGVQKPSFFGLFRTYSAPGGDDCL